MIDQEFLSAWLVYLGASFTFLLFWWLITRGVSQAWIRMVLRMPAVALLLTPLHMPLHNMPSEYIYSPAIAAFSIDLLAGHTKQALYILPYLVTSVAVCLLFGLLYLYCFPHRKH